jgi:Flp pilus assembly protein TadG
VRRTRWRSDAGSALVEFTVLSLLLLVPLVYVLLGAFQVQRAAFGATEAARQAGRAFARAESVEVGTVRAQAATRLALADQGIEGAPPPLIECPEGACLAAGSTVRVTVSYTVRLPVLSLLSRDGVGIPVSATHVAVVDTFQEGGP